MKYTVNYNLKKPEGTDTVNIDDFNINADILDAEINSLNEQIDTLVTQDNSLSAQINSLVADYIRSPGYGVTTGSANIYVLTLNPALAAYTAGVCVAVKINVANTGASTININGLGAKPIKDSKGNALVSGKLALNSVYTFRYDGTNFILQGEGGEYGTATASDVLSGKTIGTDNGLVEGIIPIKEAATITPGAIAQIIAAGQYLKGIQTISGDPDFVPANIKSGINIFGVSGTAPIPSGSALAVQVLAGYTFSNASGVGLNGSMPNNGAVNASLVTQGQQYTIPTGYHNGGKVTANISNLSADNIKKGVNVGGIVGTLKPAPTFESATIVTNSDSQYLHRLISDGGTTYLDTQTAVINHVLTMVSMTSKIKITTTEDIYLRIGSTYVNLMAGQTYEDAYGNRIVIFNPFKGNITLDNGKAEFRAISYAVYIKNT